MSTAHELRGRREGYLALFLVQVFFGLFPTFIKFAYDPAGGFHPRAVCVWRMAFGSLVLGAFAFRRYGRRAVPRRGDLLRFLACSLFGVVLNQVLALEGIARTSVGHAGLLMTLIPVFTYALAVVVRQEAFRGQRALGIAVALSGAVVLVLARGGDGGGAHDPSLAGNLLIVCNCFSYALFLVLARRLLQRYPPLVTIAWVFVGSLLSVPFVGRGVDLTPRVTALAGWGIAYTLVFPTVLSYFLNAFALARVSASTAAVFIFLQPLVAWSAAVTVFGERLTPSVVVAALLLFAGIWLVTAAPALRARPVRGEP